MKTLTIQQKLEELNVSLDAVNMGDFDIIGEFCAKKQREKSDPNYKKFGAFFRANFERTILIYYLIRQHNLSSMLEIGFGRGAGTFSAAKAFYDAGTQGRVLSIEPNVDEKFVNALQHVLTADWFKHVQFARGTSQQILPQLKDDFDFVYIDGDHSYLGTKFDWENVRARNAKLILMDDYHLPSKNDPGIQCSKFIDEIDWALEGYNEPELIFTDRLMFHDDKMQGPTRDYGQVLFTRRDVKLDAW